MCQDADKEIEVTLEMIEAGIDAFEKAFFACVPYYQGESADFDVASVYRAMEVAHRESSEHSDLAG